MTAQTGRLPAGFRVRISDGVRLFERRSVLIGGSPLRLMRLSERAQQMLGHGELVVRDEASAQLAARLLDANVAVPVPTGVVRPDELTVVIPVRDRAEQLSRALAALGPDVRCIVVDDASLAPELVADVARRHGADIVVREVNQGPAAARNAGLARVCSDYVAFVDSDVTVSGATLLRLARHMRDSHVSLVGPLISGVSRSGTPRWFERYDERAGSLGLGSKPSAVRPGAAVAWLPSACLVGRTDDLRAVGGFDARRRVGEDVDLVWRLVAANRVVRYDPLEVASHDVRPTMREWLGRKFLYGTGGAELAQRHGDHCAPAVLSPVMAMAATAVLCRRVWCIPVVIGAVSYASNTVARTLPRTRATPYLCVDLATRGLGWGVRQESALAVRHWWPATAIVSVASRRMRRLTVTALLVDTAVGLAEHPGHNPFETVFGRRLDDLAYGAGLWVGCLRQRDFAALKIRWLTRNRAT